MFWRWSLIKNTKNKFCLQAKALGKSPRKAHIAELWGIGYKNFLRSKFKVQTAILFLNSDIHLTWVFSFAL